MQLNTVVPCIFLRSTRKHYFCRLKHDIQNHTTPRRYHVHSQASTASSYSWIFPRKCRSQRSGPKQHGLYWCRFEELQVGRSQPIQVRFSSGQPIRCITLESQSQKSRPIKCDPNRYRSRALYPRSNKFSWSKRTTSDPSTGSCQSGGLQ